MYPYKLNKHFDYKNQQEVVYDLRVYILDLQIV